MTNATRSLRILLISSLFAITIACKKDKADSVNLAESTMTFKIDGVAKTYNTVTAFETVEDSTYVLKVMGVTSGDLTNYVHVYVQHTASIPAGFKVTETYAGGNEDKLLGIVGYAKDELAYANINIEDKTKQQVEIHITERTATKVKGTFSGKLYSEDEADTKAYLLTEGKFNALLIHE